jgi:hypothetical protein
VCRDAGTAPEPAAPPRPPAPVRPRRTISADWLAVIGALGATRAGRRSATALTAAPTVWPATAGGVAAQAGLAIAGRNSSGWLLSGDDHGDVVVAFGPDRGGWEQQLFETADDEIFRDLYEPIADLGDAAVWAPMSRRLRVQTGGWRITVDVDLDDRGTAASLELAAALTRAVMAEEVGAPSPGRGWLGRRRARRQIRP